jgi:integrase/recombinase XerD
VSSALPSYRILAQHLAPRSLYEYAREVRMYRAFCSRQGLGALEAASLARFATHLCEHTGLSPNSINRRLAGVKTLVRAAAEQGYVPTEVAQAFAAVRGVKVAALKTRLKSHARTRVTPREMRRLCDAPNPQTLVGCRDRALLATLASSGCRVSEVVGLTTGHLQALGEHGFVEVRGKHQVAPRRAPISPEARARIALWLERRAVQSAVIFTRFDDRVKPSPQPLSRQGAWQVVKRYSRQVGLLHVKPHDFRRFVGTELARHDIRQAQKALGHQRIETTARHYVLDTLAGGLTDHLY